MEIQFVGEHLLPGQLGNMFVVLAFVSALAATFAYYKTVVSKAELKQTWFVLGRTLFWMHGIAVLSVAITLFYIIFNHYFEYQYAWQHSSRALPVRYMFSCFWEGQEGSFLLWSIWHVVLGFVLLNRSREWEPHVMTIFCSVQAFLASMLLGIFIGDYRLGSNPFLLLREHPEFMDMPFTKVPDYLRNLDGRGLNPLLQNYWMTIHPPVLFLGFASTLVPFCFAMASLWKKEPGLWIKPALTWAYFSIMILGTGILMGGAWAYESLSFGGFWAWDPVENASLVPWLVLVGGTHVMLIYHRRKTSLLSAIILIILTFLLILYSTFLTRSGILGNTSVHAFTDLGMSGQLLIYLLFYVALAVILIGVNFKKIYKPNEEDDSSSREFWMFLGSLVLLVSAFQITFSTSIPVINKLFGSNLAPPSNAVKHYNSWQIPLAIITSVLIGIGQYFKYRKSTIKEVIKHLLFPFLASFAITGIALILLKCSNIFIGILFFAACFGVLSNLYYWVKILKGRTKNSGASIAHAGFSFILLGALLSAGFSRIISANTSGTDISQLGKDFSNAENIMLSKGDTLKMGEYFVTYKGRRQEGINHYFDVEYFSKSESGKMSSLFTLSPLIQANPRMGNAAEPDTRHYLFKDVYTHVTYVDLDRSDTKEPKVTEHTLSKGDTLYTGNSFIIFEGFYMENDSVVKNNNISVAARLIAKDIHNKTYEANPVFKVENNVIVPQDDAIMELGLTFSFVKLHPENGKIDLVMKEEKRNQEDFIIMKAIVFPFINVLWLGCLIMIAGTLIAIKEYKNRNSHTLQHESTSSSH